MCIDCFDVQLIWLFMELLQLLILECVWWLGIVCGIVISCFVCLYESGVIEVIVLCIDLVGFGYGVVVFCFVEIDQKIGYDEVVMVFVDVVFEIVDMYMVMGVSDMQLWFVVCDVMWLQEVFDWVVLVLGVVCIVLFIVMCMYFFGCVFLFVDYVVVDGFQWGQIQLGSQLCSSQNGYGMFIFVYSGRKNVDISIMNLREIRMVCLFDCCWCSGFLCVLVMICSVIVSVSMRNGIIMIVQNWKIVCLGNMSYGRYVMVSLISGMLNLGFIGCWWIQLCIRWYSRQMVVVMLLYQMSGFGIVEIIVMQWFVLQVFGLLLIQIVVGCSRNGYFQVGLVYGCFWVRLMWKLSIDWWQFYRVISGFGLFWWLQLFEVMSYFV